MASLTAVGKGSPEERLQYWQNVLDVVKSTKDPLVEQNTYLSGLHALTLNSASLGAGGVTDVEYGLVEQFLVLSCTAIWSDTRKKCCRLLAKLSFSSDHVTSLFTRFCACCSAPLWQSQHGGLQGLHALLLMYPLPSSLSFAAVSSSTQQRCSSELPALFTQTLPPLLFSMVQHDLLPVREAIVDCFDALCARLPPAEVFRHFQYIMDLLPPSSCSASSSSSLSSSSSSLFVRSSSILLPDFSAETLFNIVKGMVEIHIPVVYLRQQWTCYFPSLALYLEHPASSVRQCLSGLLQHILLKATDTDRASEVVVDPASQVVVDGEDEDTLKRKFFLGALDSLVSCWNVDMCPFQSCPPASSAMTAAASASLDNSNYQAADVFDCWAPHSSAAVASYSVIMSGDSKRPILQADTGPRHRQESLLLTYDLLLTDWLRRCKLDPLAGLRRYIGAEGGTSSAGELHLGGLLRRVAEHSLEASLAENFELRRMAEHVMPIVIAFMCVAERYVLAAIWLDCYRSLHPVTSNPSATLCSRQGASITGEDLVSSCLFVLSLKYCVTFAASINDTSPVSPSLQSIHTSLLSFLRPLLPFAFAAMQVIADHSRSSHLEHPDLMPGQVFDDILGRLAISQLQIQFVLLHNLPGLFTDAPGEDHADSFVLEMISSFPALAAVHIDDQRIVALCTGWCLLQMPSIGEPRLPVNTFNKASLQSEYWLIYRVHKLLPPLLSSLLSLDQASLLCYPLVMCLVRFADGAQPRVRLVPTSLYEALLAWLVRVAVASSHTNRSRKDNKNTPAQEQLSVCMDTLKTQLLSVYGCPSSMLSVVDCDGGDAALPADQLLVCQMMVTLLLPILALDVSALSTVAQVSCVDGASLPFSPRPVPAAMALEWVKLPLQLDLFAALLPLFPFSLAPLPMLLKALARRLTNSSLSDVLLSAGGSADDKGLFLLELNTTVLNESTASTTVCSAPSTPSKNTETLAGDGGEVEGGEEGDEESEGDWDDWDDEDEDELGGAQGSLDSGNTADQLFSKHPDLQLISAYLWRLHRLYPVPASAACPCAGQGLPSKAKSFYEVFADQSSLTQSERSQLSCLMRMSAAS